uniref:Uncharacterized protein n=1 Tax=Chromera velia CCMP2878 TaxID=1169474 RepID=A0A0G4HDX3_9ALVE|eukprot:Cvel_26590.t1-p1 / transcript=Cvel_26590.t1 / gene=Cvel_26590 / organism=Chromera_velia_CCMP2878 / gene_product=hypothetical protein / transcript_product=hypothetical protein / location=Cvel_scaffold3185:11859-18749(-) / protein_length=1488 / sequence_SO=supercontig / SO=protein_coding / is_pseudo=false
MPIPSPSASPRPGQTLSTASQGSGGIAMAAAWRTPAAQLAALISSGEVPEGGVTEHHGPCLVAHLRGGQQRSLGAPAGSPQGAASIGLGPLGENTAGIKGGEEGPSTATAREPLPHHLIRLLPCAAAVKLAVLEVLKERMVLAFLNLRPGQLSLAASSAAGVPVSPRPRSPLKAQQQQRPWQGPMEVGSSAPAGLGGMPGSRLGHPSPSRPSPPSPLPPDPAEVARLSGLIADIPLEDFRGYPENNMLWVPSEFLWKVRIPKRRLVPMPPNDPQSATVLTAKFRIADHKGDFYAAKRAAREWLANKLDAAWDRTEADIAQAEWLRKMPLRAADALATGDGGLPPLMPPLQGMGPTQQRSSIHPGLVGPFVPSLSVIHRIPPGGGLMPSPLEASQQGGGGAFVGLSAAAAAAEQQKGGGGSGPQGAPGGPRLLQMPVPDGSVPFPPPQGMQMQLGPWIGAPPFATGLPPPGAPGAPPSVPLSAASLGISNPAEFVMRIEESRNRWLSAEHGLLLGLGGGLPSLTDTGRPIQWETIGVSWQDATGGDGGGTWTLAYTENGIPSKVVATPKDNGGDGAARTAIFAKRQQILSNLACGAASQILQDTVKANPLDPSLPPRVVKFLPLDGLPPGVSFVKQRQVFRVAYTEKGDLANLPAHSPQQPLPVPAESGAGSEGGRAVKKLAKTLKEEPPEAPGDVGGEGRGGRTGGGDPQAEGSGDKEKEKEKAGQEGESGGGDVTMEDVSASSASAAVGTAGVTGGDGPPAIEAGTKQEDAAAETGQVGGVKLAEKDERAGDPVGAEGSEKKDPTEEDIVDAQKEKEKLAQHAAAAERLRQLKDRNAFFSVQRLGFGYALMEACAFKHHKETELFEALGLPPSLRPADVLYGDCIKKIGSICAVLVVDPLNAPSPFAIPLTLRELQNDLSWVCQTSILPPPGDRVLGNLTHSLSGEKDKEKEGGKGEGRHTGPASPGALSGGHDDLHAGLNAINSRLKSVASAASGGAVDGGGSSAGEGAIRGLGGVLGDGKVEDEREKLEGGEDDRENEKGKGKGKEESREEIFMKRGEEVADDLRTLKVGARVQVSGQTKTDGVRGWFDGIVTGPATSAAGHVPAKVRTTDSVWREVPLRASHFVWKREDCVRRALAPSEGFWRLGPPIEATLPRVVDVGSVVSLRDPANSCFSYDAVVLGYSRISVPAPTVGAGVPPQTSPGGGSGQTGRSLQQQGGAGMGGMEGKEGYAQKERMTDRLQMLQCGMKDAGDNYFDAHLPFSAVAQIQPFSFAKRTVQAVKTKVRQFRSSTQQAQMRLAHPHHQHFMHVREMNPQQTSPPASQSESPSRPACAAPPPPPPPPPLSASPVSSLITPSDAGEHPQGGRGRNSTDPPVNSSTGTGAPPPFPSFPAEGDVRMQTASGVLSASASASAGAAADAPPSVVLLRPGGMPGGVGVSPSPFLSSSPVPEGAARLGGAGGGGGLATGTQKETTTPGEDVEMGDGG